MKYISDIKANGKSLDYIDTLALELDGLEIDDVFTIVTHDIDTGTTTETTEEVYNIDFSELELDCYGVGMGPILSRYFIVRHTNLTIQLYKYIRLVKTDYRPYKLPSSCVDSCTLDKQDTSSKVLEIYVEDNEIWLLGQCGSAAVLNDFDVIKVFSLYDFLNFMCRETHLSIMTYGAVRFFDSHGKCTTIVFSHEGEADIFFTKMLLMGSPQISNELSPKVPSLTVITYDMETDKK